MAAKGRVPACVIATLLVATALASLASPATATPEARCVPLFDVLFVVDTTASMAGALSQAQHGHLADVMTAVGDSVPTVDFGIADYKDYDGWTYLGHSDLFGSDGDYPWWQHAGIGGDRYTIQVELNQLSASGGGAAGSPDSLVRALAEAQSSMIGWRDGAHRAIVLITDTPGYDHDFNGSGRLIDPGPDKLVGSVDDLDFTQVVASLAASGTRVAVVDTGSVDGSERDDLAYVANQTGGERIVLGNGSFVDETSALLTRVLGTSSIAESFAASASATTADGASFVLHKESQQLLPPGTSTASTYSQAIGPYTLSYAGAHDSTDGCGDPGDARASASSTLSDVTLTETLTGVEVLHADDITSEAHSVASPAAPASDGGVRVAGLRVLGQSAQAPDTGLASLTFHGGVLGIDERSGGSEVGASWLVVRGLHLTYSSASGNIDLILGSAMAGATTGAKMGIVAPTREFGGVTSNPDSQFTAPLRDPTAPAWNATGPANVPVGPASVQRARTGGTGNYGSRQEDEKDRLYAATSWVGYEHRGAEYDYGPSQDSSQWFNEVDACVAIFCPTLLAQEMALDDHGHTDNGVDSSWHDMHILMLNSQGVLFFFKTDKQTDCVNGYSCTSRDDTGMSIDAGGQHVDATRDRRTTTRRRMTWC